MKIITNEFDKELHLIFIDSTQVYDIIDREELRKVLKVLGIAKKYVNHIK